MRSKWVFAFFFSILGSSASLAAAALSHGPFVGHTTPNTATLWARASRPGVYLLVATGEVQKKIYIPARADMENDLCMTWHLVGLSPKQTYRYEIRQQREIITKGMNLLFTTPSPANKPTKVKLAFGSCAREGDGSKNVWQRIGAIGVDAVILLGDTPYIDSTKLNIQRKRHAEFAASGIKSLLRSTPYYAIWDDHDFGLNDTDGQLPGKENSLRAFKEYHANPSYGENDRGLYTSFRLGAAEVFLLDTRYFAAAEPSPIDPKKPTLLGKSQWQWLQKKLLSSTAPFKILACGMIWNGSTRPNKPDQWETYSHEREALFQFIGKNNISGVVLVGGDIHRSRVLRYPTENSAGYKITELITSPVHDGVSKPANAPHPHLIRDAGVPNTFMLLTVDSTRTSVTMNSQFLDAAGEELFSIPFSIEELQAK